jgi:predicted Zn-dependent protease
MIWIIPLAIIVISFLVIGLIFYKKIPKLRVIDVDSIPKEQTRKIKEKIILRKFKRAGGGRVKVINKKSAAVVNKVSKHGRRAVQKLYALEQYYQKLKRTDSDGQHSYDSETIKKLIQDAEGLVRKDEFIPAEKIFIDIISHNPKNVDAYEALGNMYIENDSFDQARETFQFALKLSPKDASVLVSLAELEIQLEKPKAAVEHLRKAVQKRSKNPKYLDLYIEASLEAGSLKDAREGIKLLKEVNPENTKIAGFEKEFAKKKDLYVSKTSS